MLAARGHFRSLLRTRHRLACAESPYEGKNALGKTITCTERSRWEKCEGTNPPGNAIACNERSRWEKKINIPVKVRGVWTFYAPLRPSNSRVKGFNGGRASRAGGLFWANLPNGHTTPTPHRVPAPATSPSFLLFRPPQGGACVCLACYAHAKNPIRSICFYIRRVRFSSSSSSVL